MTYYAYVYAVTTTTGAVAVQASQQNNNAAIRANTSHINSTTTTSQQSQTQETGKKASSNPKDLKKTFMLVSNPYLLMLKVLKHSILKSEKAAEAPSLEGSNDGTEESSEETEERIVPGENEGVIYRVPGEDTPSGEDYIGSANDLEKRNKGANDGRNRDNAEVIDTYELGNRAERRAKEQQAINDNGGVGNLDNKRNEIAEKKWEAAGVTNND